MANSEKSLEKTSEAKTPAVNADSPSTRFMNLVVREFQSSIGEIQLTNQMKRLLQNYFIKLDSILKDNETKRMKAPEQSRSATKFDWANVNLEKLSQEAIAFAMIGLDPMQSNHLNLIPYLNSTTNKFDIGFLPGYKGIELKAKAFGLDSEIPINEVIELVYENDEFSVKKKDSSNPIESYTFSVSNPFNRGAVTGGFYYFEFPDPRKNFIHVMTKADIDKRKPKYASPEFWGGTKSEYVNGKATGKKVEIEGWFEEMAYKTLYRKAYGSITIDGQKINDHFVAAMNAENQYITLNTRETTALDQVKEKVAIEANTEEVGFEFVTADSEEKQVPLTTIQSSNDFPPTA